MTYKVNGTEISTQPTTGRWMPRDSIGIDGNGHPIYVGVRRFELKWQLIDPATFNQLIGFYNSVAGTGSAVVDLPEYAKSTYAFYSYTGCIIEEPQIDAYFTQHHLNASLLITNIVT